MALWSTAWPAPPTPPEHRIRLETAASTWRARSAIQVERRLSLRAPRRWAAAGHLLDHIKLQVVQLSLGPSRTFPTTRFLVGRLGAKGTEQKQENRNGRELKSWKLPTREGQGQK